MQTDDIYSHAIDWIWGLIIAVAGVVGGAIVRIWRHEERIKALEQANSERVQAIRSLGDKVDDDHNDVARKIDSLGDEIRADLRIIMARLLKGE